MNELLPGPLPSRIDPEDPFVSLVGEIAVDGYSPATLRVLRSGWRAWRAACAAQGLAPLPCPESVLYAELRRRLDAGERRATIETMLLYPVRCAALRSGTPDPTHTVLFRDTWAKLCRERLPRRQEQAEPILGEDLARLYTALDPDRPRDCLLAALAGLAYEAMLRVSELVAIERRHLQRQPDGRAVLLIPRSKTDQEGRGAEVAVPAGLVAWIERHQRFAAAREPEGPWLFPSPYRRGVAHLTQRQAIRLLREAGLRVGCGDWSGHSGRVGAAQDMAMGGHDVTLMMLEGRWKTASMPARYAERAQALRRGARRRGVD